MKSHWLGFWGFLSESFMRIKSREPVMERHRFCKSGRDGRQAQWEATKSWSAGSALLCWVVKVVLAQINCDVHAMIYKIFLQNAVVCRFMRTRLVRRKSASLKACRFYILHSSVNRHYTTVTTTMLILISNRERLLSTSSSIIELNRFWLSSELFRLCAHEEAVISTSGGKRTVSGNGNFMIRPNNTRLSLRSQMHAFASPQIEI